MKFIYFANHLDKVSLIDSLCDDLFITVDHETIGKSSRQPLSARLASPDPTFFPELSSYSLRNKIGLRINSLDNLSVSELYCINSFKPDFVIMPMIKNHLCVLKLRSMLSQSISIIPLIETCSSLVDISSICSLPFIERVHLGLNDLSIQLGSDFMFNFLANDFFEYFCRTCISQNVSFGFGGISAPCNNNDLRVNPYTLILEHVRVKSDCAIIARSLENMEANDIVSNIHLLRSTYFNSFGDTELLSHNRIKLLSSLAHCD